MEFNFENLLGDYEHQLDYIKRMTEPKTLSFYKTSKEYWEGYYEAVHKWFEDMKTYYCDDFKPIMREATKEEEKEFLYQDQPPIKMLEYRGLCVPIYDDDYGQQYFMVFEGKEYGGGSFNGFPEYDFCYIIDDVIDRKYALGGKDDDQK